MSGGEQQMLAMGRALMSNASMLMLDEPSIDVYKRQLLPRAPVAGKRILLEYLTPLWKRMSFSQKTTARNLFRYKKRFFMTVLGVAGCTALLLSLIHILQIGWQ